MSEFRINESFYLCPTPAGAFHSVSRIQVDPARRLLRALLQALASPKMDQAQIKEWSGSGNDEEAMELLYRCQSLGWIEGLETSRDSPKGTLEDLLPGLIGCLSSNRKALLADTQGFYIASNGFHHEAAEELSALSADLASLQQRHRGLLENNLGVISNAWAAVDASGNSQIGFWPLFIGEQRFVLVLGGYPRFNQPELVDLIWVLTTRYGNQ